MILGCTSISIGDIQKQIRPSFKKSPCSIRKHDNCVKIGLLAKIRFLVRNLKICLEENPPTPPLKIYIFKSSFLYAREDLRCRTAKI